MPAAHCPICLSHLPINKFVVFPCGIRDPCFLLLKTHENNVLLSSNDMTGHGFCIDCKSCIFQGSVRSNCPNCRLRIRDQDAHPLFLELVDSKVAFASSLVEDLDKMDHETPLLSVKKAGQKLTKVLQDSQPDPNAMVKRGSLFCFIFFLIPFFASPKRLHLSRLQKISTNVSFLSLPK